MSVEENWEDITIYSVSFVSVGSSDHIAREFHRTFAFVGIYDEDEVADLISLKLNNTVSVLSVDELTEALLLKK
ncbi:hypothetical protein [Carnobacterium maltaromaticum]|uniref:hypothetical protein n=1 Tax=Carnobacterium maltaromaticum TaxID=2751 RepID=UPI0012F9E9A4|nr:hypothetical protein [Carnobacterium maltaromaticum]